MARIVFLTCHLTGTGHLVRTLTLARAAMRTGHQVTVLSGGRPLSHLETSDVDLVQLPSLVVHGFEFTTLRRPDGGLADADYMSSRADLLTSVLRDSQPDALVTELFPFGRRVLAAEFEHAITAARAARPDCAIISSIRDVPEPKPRRIEETAARVATHFDAVLVHGDPDVIPLDVAWPLSAPAKSRVIYAGYLGAPRSALSSARGDTVLVAAGGGVLGRDLLTAAAQASEHSQRPWRVLVGGADAAEVSETLRQRSTNQRLWIEPARSDYHALLAQAACSVSLCGYNTALDLAQETIPALLVPSEEADEKEQLIRARHWALHDGIDLMRMQDLTPDGLALAVDRLIAAGDRAKLPLNIDDGARAVAVIEDTIAAKSSA